MPHDRSSTRTPSSAPGMRSPPPSPASGTGLVPGGGPGGARHRTRDPRRSLTPASAGAGVGPGTVEVPPASPRKARLVMPGVPARRHDLRNVAIVAHVDHGK